MASTSSASSTRKRPSARLSTKDYMIRTKALDLLQRASEVDHQIVHENDDDDSNSEFSWITPISYQHCPSLPGMECAESARMTAQDQWIDIFVPAVSGVAKACREGVLCVVKQTSDGFQEIKNDIQRKQQQQQHRMTMKKVSSSRPPALGNTKRDQVQTGNQQALQRRHAAGQHTAEQYSAASVDPYEDDELLCYHPGEWKASGVLFIPTEELRHYQYDDVSAMTDDGSGKAAAVNKKCVGLFCPVPR